MDMSCDWRSIIKLCFYKKMSTFVRVELYFSEKTSAFVDDLCEVVDLLNSLILIERSIIEMLKK